MKAFKIYKPLFLVLLSFTALKTTHAQSVYPLGKGVPHGIEAHCFYNGNLYVVYPKDTNLVQAPNKTKNIKYILSTWNGVFWSIRDSFTVNSPINSNYGLTQGFVTSMIFYYGKLYIGGSFDSVLNVNYSRHIIKWMNKGWNGIGGATLAKDTLTTIRTMTLYKNQLYVSGKFDTLPGTHANNIAAWDGSKWNALGTPGHEGAIWNSNWDTSSISNLLVNQDTLYVMGFFNICGGNNIKYIAKWDGTNWSGNYFSNMQPWAIYSMIFYKGEMYVNGWGDPPATGPLYKYSNSLKNWIEVKGAPYAIWTFAIINGKLWCEGTDCAVYDGTKWEYIKSPGAIDGGDVDITLLDTFKNNLYLIGNYYIKYTSYLNEFQGNTNAGIINTNIEKISGYVYEDLNGNCQKDWTDKPLKNEIVEVTPGPFYYNTDDSGYYEIYLPAGNYKISCATQKYWKQTCPVSPAYYSFSDTKDTIHENVNFASTIKPDIKDMKISVVCRTGGYVMRRGFTNYYRLLYQNVGTIDNASSSFYLNLPSGFSNFLANPNPDSYNNQKAIWNYSNLKIGETRYIDFQIRADSTHKLGDTISFNAGFDELTNINDSNLVDNFDTLKQIIVSSCDPNGKQSYPAGDISSASTILKYMIHFQNTGTAPAAKVVVADTLDMALPMSEVIINSASHPYTLQVVKNVLIWTFDNINLPDSSHDPVNSIGYISYSTCIRNAVTTGHEIKNKAYIYFDYELPIVTNQTSNKIIYQSNGIDHEYYSAGNLKVYPNPANQQIVIQNLGDSDFRITLYNILGQPMNSLNVPASQNITVDVSRFSTGIYFIRTNNFKSTSIIIKH